jgi:aryl-alcohol dehydrogenase-like predicted oxidoreductase
MKALGLSDARGWARFVAAQYQYSLVVRDIEPEFIDLCLSEGVGLIPWGPLGGGFLSGKYRSDQRPTEASQGRLASTPDAWEESWQRRSVARNWSILDAVHEVADRHGRTASQVALAWLLAQDAVASVVFGARTLEQLADNVGSTAFNLTSEDVSLLGRASEVPAAYPYRGVTALAR